MLLFPIFDVAPASAAVHGEARIWRMHDEGVLGTSFDLIAVGGDRDDARRCVEAAGLEIARLCRVLDSRTPGSELHRLNEGTGGAASPELLTVLQQAEAWRARSGGAYDPRLGALVEAWATAEPSESAIASALQSARHPILLDHAAGAVRKPADLTFALDGFAKGYVVDRAFDAARAVSPRLRGLALGIGGDLRCGGEGPADGCWPLSLPLGCDPGPTLHVRDAAVATSGEGPRDRVVEGRRLSQTLSPFIGRPLEGVRAVTAIARRAADADALATALMVMEPDRGLDFADSLDGVAARIVRDDGGVYVSRRWALLAQPPRPRTVAPSGKPRPLAPAALSKWPADWAVELSYVAPDKRDDNDADFRTPYMVIWITDAQNRPVRTVMMVGKDPKWQRDNFIWWGSNREAAARLVDLRSEATNLSGRYSLFWRGVDDAYDRLPTGDYLLHVETSQEHGKHSHRTLPLKIGRDPFETVLPPTRESGGLKITYGLNP